MQKLLLLLSLSLLLSNCKKEEPQEPNSTPTPHALLTREWEIESFVLDGVEKIYSFTRQDTTIGSDGTYTIVPESVVRKGTYDAFLGIDGFYSTSIRVENEVTRFNTSTTEFVCAFYGRSTFEPENNNRFFIDNTVFDNTKIEGNITRLDELHFEYEGFLSYSGEPFDTPFKLVCTREE